MFGYHILSKCCRLGGSSLNLGMQAGTFLPTAFLEVCEFLVQ